MSDPSSLESKRVVTAPAPFRVPTQWRSVHVLISEAIGRISFSRSRPMLLLREVRSVDGADTFTYPALGSVVSRSWSDYLLSAKCTISSSKGTIRQMACDIGRMYETACR